MITVSLGTLNNDLFWGAMEVLENIDVPIPVALRISKIRRKLAEEVKESGPLYTKIIQEFAETDENGNIKTKMVDDQGLKKPIYILKKDIDTAAYQHKINEFFGSQITIEDEPIKISELGDINITAKHIDLLGPVIVID